MSKFITVDHSTGVGSTGISPDSDGVLYTMPFTVTTDEHAILLITQRWSEADTDSGVINDVVSTDAGDWFEAGQNLWVQYSPEPGTRDYTIMEDASSAGDWRVIMMSQINGAIPDTRAIFGFDFQPETDTPNSDSDNGFYDSSGAYQQYIGGFDVPTTDHLYLIYRSESWDDNNPNTGMIYMIQDSTTMSSTLLGISATNSVATALADTEPFIALQLSTLSLVDTDSASSTGDDPHLLALAEQEEATKNNRNGWMVVLLSPLTFALSDLSGTLGFNGVINKKFFRTFEGILTFTDIFIKDIRKFFVQSIIPFFFTSSDNEVEVELRSSANAQIEMPVEGRST